MSDQTLRAAADDRAQMGSGGLRLIVRRELLTVMLSAEAAAKANATGAPRVRGGALRRSIVGGLVDTATGLELSLTAGADGPAQAYAKIQDEGGTVRPKRSRFLAIPKGPALTAAGVSRYGSPRDVPSLRFQPIRGGSMGLLVKDVTGRRARSEIWYVLVRQVTVPGTRYLTKAWTNAVPQGREALARALQEAGLGAD